jgi:hypothetical protein
MPGFEDAFFGAMLDYTAEDRYLAPMWRSRPALR